MAYEIRLDDIDRRLGYLEDDWNDQKAQLEALIIGLAIAERLEGIDKGIDALTNTIAAE